MNSVVILLHVQKHPVKLGGCHMDGILLDHFQWLPVILYHDMPAINEGMELLQTEAY